MMLMYGMYFYKGEPEDIIAANSRKLHYKEDFEGSDKDASDDLAENSKIQWERFIRENQYVSIGELYNKCEGEDRIMVGKTVMLIDKEKGGVKSRTFLNVTWDKLIDDGEMSIEVTYNGKDLYSNKWDLCTIDEDEPERIIFCPIKSGERKYIKDLKIPNYLPKGRYVTKAHSSDQDGETIACAFSDFVL